MPTTLKKLFRGAAATTVQTLYTVPSSTTTSITNIVVTNTAGSSATYTLSIGGQKLAENITVGANDSAVIDIKQVINATETITGLASATTVIFHISGVEIS
jgi:hypothetical protein